MHINAGNTRVHVECLGNAHENTVLHPKARWGDNSMTSLGVSSWRAQELVKRLHGALEARPCLAAAVLDRHLPLLLQLPGALRLLLWALPAAHSSQALVYRRLCACFDAGEGRRDSLSSAMQLGACLPALCICIGARWVSTRSQHAVPSESL